MSASHNDDGDTPLDEPNAEAGGDGGHDAGGRGGLAPPPDDEPVGYRHPPKRHQFKPGQSGNPKGRPKGAPGLRKILRKELSSRMNVKEGSRRLRMSKLQYVVKRELEKAMDGEQRAIEHIISLNIQLFGLGAEDQARDDELTQGEQLYLDAMMRRLGPASDYEAGHPADEASAGDAAQESGDEEA